MFDNCWHFCQFWTIFFLFWYFLRHWLQFWQFMAIFVTWQWRQILRCFLLITGCVEVLLMHPLDLMKTRFQLQGNAVPGDPGHYKGVTLQSSVNANLSNFSRWATAWWRCTGRRGSGPSGRGLYLQWWSKHQNVDGRFFELQHKLLNSHFCYSSSPLSSSRRSFALGQTSQLLWWGWPTNCIWPKCILGQTYSLAGLGAGVTEAIIVNPFEVVKVGRNCFFPHVKIGPG